MFQQLIDLFVVWFNKILCVCVYCGFCIVICLIYQVLGDELDSLCGWIYLIKDMLENGWDVDEKIVKYLDCCFGCLSCMMICFLGVDYMYLIDYVWLYVEQIYCCLWCDWVLCWMLVWVLLYVGCFWLVLMVVKLVWFFVWLMFDVWLCVMLEMVFGLLFVFMCEDGVYLVEGLCCVCVVLMLGCVQCMLNIDINVVIICLL